MHPNIPNLLHVLDASILGMEGDRYRGFRESILHAAADKALLAESPRLAPRVAGQIAVISMGGFIIHHEGIDRWCSWFTSTEALAHAFDDAMGNPDVGAIVIDCDSNGGTVEGVPELADRIFAARGQGKRIVSVINAHMNSAAYFIGSQADEVVVTPSGEGGNVGVYTMHTDFSGMDAQYGIKRTVIAAGQYKAEGVVGPLTEEAAAALKGRVVAIYDLFAAAVARGRGVSDEDVRNGFGKGRVLAARDAVAAGVADRIATLEQVLGELSGRIAPARKGRARAEAPLATPIAANAHISPVAAESPEFSRLVSEMCALAGANLGVNQSLLMAGAPPSIPPRVAGAKTCPDCGAGMVDVDGELECPDCDPPETEASAPPLAAVAPPVRPATPAVPPAPSTKPALQARSHSVNEEELAAQRVALEAQVRAAETTRQNEIRALCAENNIEAPVMNGFVDNGITADAASKEILIINRKRRAAGTVDIRVGETRETQKPWNGFGDFATAVMAAGAGSSPIVDDRLRILGAATGINQGVPSEGGFLVPPTYSQQIWGEVLTDPDSLLSMTDDYPVEGESLTLPAVDETTRADGTIFGGVQAYWLNEADQATKSKPKWRAARLEPQELAVLIYATDKSLRNSPAALQTFLQRAAVGAINFKVGNAIMNGIGTGQPLGWNSSKAVVTVNKESGQANGTIVRENVSKMWARLHPRAKAGAVWIINGECEPQLDDLNQTVKNVAGTENVGGYASKIYDAEKNTLKGRPILTLEYAEALGAKGDIQLVNPKWYFTGTRGAGIRTEISIHVRFEFAEQAFRFMYEIDGQPAIAAPITPFKGANTLSAFVNLQAR